MNILFPTGEFDTGFSSSVLQYPDPVSHVVSAVDICMLFGHTASTCAPLSRPQYLSSTPFNLWSNKRTALIRKTVQSVEVGVHKSKRGGYVLAWANKGE